MATDLADFINMAAQRARGGAQWMNNNRNAGSNVGSSRPSGALPYVNAGGSGRALGRALDNSQRAASMANMMENIQGQKIGDSGRALDNSQRATDLANAEANIQGLETGGSARALGNALSNIGRSARRGPLRGVDFATAPNNPQFETNIPDLPKFNSNFFFGPEQLESRSPVNPYVSIERNYHRPGGIGELKEDYWPEWAMLPGQAPANNVFTQNGLTSPLTGQSMPADLNASAFGRQYKLLAAPYSPGSDWMPLDIKQPIPMEYREPVFIPTTYGRG